MRRFLLPLPLLLVALAPPRAAAQGARDTTEAVHASAAIGVHYGNPLRFSLAAGGMIDLNGHRDDGILMMAEPGQGGMKISAGYFKMRRFGRGYSIRLAGIRTGDKPWTASPQTTYLGVEGHLMVFLGVGARAGWFRRAGGESGAGLKDNIGTLGASIGL
jgi:hypothetical protein